MRVKIKGEVTDESLSMALSRALESILDVCPGARVHGASIYLKPVDENGVAFDILDEHGEPLILTVQAPPSIAPKRREVSPLSEEDLKMQERSTREEALAQENRAECERQRKIREEADQRANVAYEALNALTENLLQTQAERFITNLNEAIRSTWETLDPREAEGQKKGHQKPIPSFSVKDGRLLMSVSSWKQPKRPFNPVGTLPSLGQIRPMWNFPAWLVATNRFVDVIEDLSGSVPEGIRGKHLPGYGLES